MPTTVYDSSALTKRKQDKMIANSFLSRIQGQPCNTGSASFLGISQQSVINEVRMGQIPLIRRNEGGCTTVELGCPCQGPTLVSSPVIPETQWNILGNAFNDLNNSVRAFAVAPNGDVYVGGSFTLAGATTVNHVAKWDGSSWSALGGGTNGVVLTLLLLGTTLFVGGTFTLANSVPSTQRIAAYNTVTGVWSTLGGVANPIAGSGNVNALTAIGTSVYVGGGFSVALGSSYNYIAAFNTATNTWSALGTGLNQSVYALTTDGTTLYVGGDFTNTAVAGPALNKVAAWNPSASTWSALSTGFVAGYIEALTIFNGALYAGHVTLGVNVWNGATWSSVGPTGTFTNIGEVVALTSYGNKLYAGGTFTTPGTNVAVWNGSSWSNVSNGTNNPVYALTIATQGGFPYLFVGGAFTQAGPPPLPVLSADYIATYGPI